MVALNHLGSSWTSSHLFPRHAGRNNVVAKISLADNGVTKPSDRVAEPPNYRSELLWAARTGREVAWIGGHSWTRSCGAFEHDHLLSAASLTKSYFNFSRTELFIDLGSRKLEGYCSFLSLKS